MVADALSQPPATPMCHLAADTSLSACFSTAAAVAQPILSYTLMAAAQQSCPGVAALRASSSLRLTTQHVGGQPLLGDISMRVFRPVVPLSFWQQVFDTMHNTAHPGTCASKRLIITVIDRTTRWTEAIPLQLTSAAACACALFCGWIARFGMLAVMTSDRGS